MIFCVYVPFMNVVCVHLYVVYLCQVPSPGIDRIYLSVSLLISVLVLFGFMQGVA
jgi:hypothetical protein